MPGLIREPLEPLPGEGGPANTSEADVAGEGFVEASPEEQQQYTTFVTNGMKLLDDPAALPKVFEAMKGENPVEGLANALSMLVMRLEDSSSQQGQKFSGDVLLQGGTELLEQMVDLAEAGGIHKFTEKEMESALYLALDKYRETRGEQGALPQGQLSRDFEELQRADRAGELEGMFPGLGEHAKGMPKPGGEAPKGGG